MWRIFTSVLLTGVLFVCSCNQVEESPKMQQSLAQSEWVITGYLTPISDEPMVSPAIYQMNFINDSTFILNLDINRVVGKYIATRDGNFQVVETKQTRSCCDSEYALQLAKIILEAQNYRTTQDGVTLQGVGDVFLKQKKKEIP